MSDEHPREIDPVTGYDTTGHEWNGIRELNTPFPRIVIWALVLTVVYSVISWVLLPAWPLGRDYTRGLLGLDQGEMAIAGLENLSATRQDWMAEFAGGDFAALQSDPALLDRAMPSAARLFSDNCAGCHGAEGAGGPGFPVLRDDHWLWGGEPETIAETIRVGINADHPDTRLAEMPPFSWMSYDERHALAAYVAALHEGTADPDSDAATLFYDNCAACHGDTGEGGLMIGAPSLRDAAVLYGQSPEIVAQTLLHGRRGVMPSWSGRLSEAEINLLATYVASLGTSPGAAQ